MRGRQAKAEFSLSLFPSPFSQGREAEVTVWLLRPVCNRPEFL